MSNTKKLVNIQTLPVEIMVHIFERLDLGSKILMERVCRRWRDIIQAHVWQKTTYFNFNADTDIEIMKIRENENIEKAKKKLADIAKRCASHLRDVKLTGFHFSYYWQMLLSHIPVNQLQHLEVDGCRFDYSHLLQVAERFSTLKSFKIGYTYAIHQALNEFFKTCCILEQLVMKSELTDVSFENVPCTLKHLKMDFLEINNDQLAQIGDRCLQLEYLKLSGETRHCDLNSLFSKLKHLKRVVIRGVIPVQVLSLGHIKELSYLKICPQNFLCDLLLQSIGQISQLTILSLAHCDTKRDDDYSANGLLHLASLHQLEQLNLDSIKHLSDSVLMAIVKSNPGLKYLNVSGCSLITDDSILYVLDTCPLLNKFHLSYCAGVTRKTLDAIFQKLAAEHGDTLPEHNESKEKFFQFDYYKSGIDEKEEDVLSQNPWLFLVKQHV